MSVYHQFEQIEILIKYCLSVDIWKKEKHKYTMFHIESLLI